MTSVLRGLIYADDSGGETDRLRSLAALSGPASVFVTLERDLRAILRLHQVRELKWAALRTRPDRLQAASAWLDLLAVALAAGALRLDVALWRPALQGAAYRGRSESQRLRPLYALAWTSAARTWGLGEWRAYPDQRTGMDWQRWSPAQCRAWRRAGMRDLTVRETPSQSSACVQLADLLAGLCRLEERPDGDEAGRRAYERRQALRNGFVLACAARGLVLGAKDGLLHVRRPKLHIRLLHRLPRPV